LVDEKDISPFFRRQVEDFNNEDCIEHIGQLSLCLNKLPTFSDEFAELNEGDWRFQTWLFDPDIGDLCWNAVNQGTVYKDAFAAGLYFPNMMDPTLAPEGKYTATVCCLFAWPLDTPKEKYEEQSEKSTNMIIDSYTRYMPDFRDCVDDTFLNCPPVWESEYGSTGGTWTHGMIKLDNMLNFRPIVGMTDYRAPIKNMYLCGTSNHPGPGITGFQPLNAVRALLADAGEAF
jgi:phytoene dehydrogenase-like protein